LSFCFQSKIWLRKWMWMETVELISTVRFLILLSRDFRANKNKSRWWKRDFNFYSRTIILKMIDGVISKIKGEFNFFNRKVKIVRGIMKEMKYNYFLLFSLQCYLTIKSLYRRVVIKEITEKNERMLCNN